MLKIIQKIKNKFTKERDSEKEFEKAILIYRMEVFDDKLVLAEVAKILFNSKYIEVSDNPYEALLGLFRRASIGDEKLLQDPFFRLMRRDRDTNVLKINTILKNNLK